MRIMIGTFWAIVLGLSAELFAVGAPLWLIGLLMWCGLVCSLLWQIAWLQRAPLHTVERSAQAHAVRVLYPELPAVGETPYGISDVRRLELPAPTETIDIDQMR